MTCQIAIQNVGSVGMCIKVHHANVAESFGLSNCSCGGPGDGMVATKCDRNNAATGNFADSGFDIGQADIGLAVWAICITEIDNFEVIKNLNTQVHVIAARFVGL